jgi:hypothetical protein
MKQTGISASHVTSRNYGAQSEDNLFGDGYEYTVYSCPEGEFLPFFNGAYSRKNSILQKKVTEILDDLKVEKQNRPDFSHKYQWKIFVNKGNYINTISENDTESAYDVYDLLYIIYDTNSHLVYFAQDVL